MFFVCLFVFFSCIIRSNGRYGVPVQLSYRYTRLFPESTPESAEVPWRKRTFSHEHGGHTWNRVHPSAKYQHRNKICGKLSIYASKRETAKLMLMLLYLNSAIPLSNLREASQTCQSTWSATIPYRPRGLPFTWWGCYGLCLWHKLTELAHSFSFCSLVCFCLYGPFNCISPPKFSRKLSVCSFCSSGLIPVLLVLSTVYISLWKSSSALIQSLVVDWAVNTN